MSSSPAPAPEHPPALASHLPVIWQWLLQALTVGSILLIFTQHLDLECSVKDLHTKLQYKGNWLLEQAKPHEK